jgi:hypothetical protein
MAEKRAIARILVDAKAKSRMDDLCKKKGMTQIAMLSHVAKWFLDQDEKAQAMVLGLLAEELTGPQPQALLKHLLGKVSAADGRK